MATQYQGNDYQRRNGGKSNNTQSNAQFKAQRDFFYKNAYSEDILRGEKMANNVFRDLTPFSDYLRKSIDNLKNAAGVGANIEPIKDCEILRPLFSLLEIKSREAFIIQKPQGNFYVLDWLEDWGDAENFDTIVKGRKVICENDSVIDVYNGKIILKLDEQISIAEKYSLLTVDDDVFKQCSLRELTFKDSGDFRIASTSAKILSSYSDGNNVICYFEGNINKKDEVRLFDKINCHVVDVKKLGIKKGMDIRMDGVSVKVYDEEKGLLLADLGVEPERKLFCGREEIAFRILSEAEICEILDDENITFNGTKIEVVGDIEKYEIKGLKFEKLSQRNEYRRMLKVNGKDRKNPYVGRFVELIEDENFKNDVDSNVSYFFRETTEFLSNIPQGAQKNANKRIFKIGYRSERDNVIEICEVRDGKLSYIYDQTMPQKLYVVPNTRQLQMQLNAVRALIDKPFEEHLPLLELMNGKRLAQWGAVPYTNEKIKKWYRIDNKAYDGYKKQREFVQKALATPDFAILEGPPGSGKTTVILEIIAQMVMRGQKVMLAASTNAAIDNILERISDLPDEVREKLLAVRIGSRSAISDSVKDYTVFDIADKDKDMANEIIRRSNLVCGTIIGVLQHPEFELAEKDKPVVPIYDCLIVDEASKTTFQEFLVPAIYAKRWILSGDLKQLTPYVEQDNIVSALQNIKDFDEAHQMAQTILMTLENSVFSREDIRNMQVKFCICVDDRTLNAVCDLIEEYPRRRIGILGNVIHNKNSVTVEDFRGGKRGAIFAYGADILFVSKNGYQAVEKYLPVGFITLFAKGKGMLHYGANCFYEGYGKSFETNFNNSRLKNLGEFKGSIEGVLKEKSWASEIAWRLCRIQELFLLPQIGDGKAGNIIEKYLTDIQTRIPTYVKESVKKEISLVKEIALPSIIQLLQQGVDKDIVKNKYETTLNGGFDEKVLDERHVLVEYQHRMHNEISEFSAQNIYGGKALRNGTVIDRDWDYDEYPSRSYWLDVSNKQKCTNKNIREADAVIDEIKKFLDFAKKNPRKDKDGNIKPWTLACLTYYRAQESELKNKLASLQKGKPRNFYKLENNNAEIMIYTVDKFQGKEADIVFLSMVKTENAPLGFMDSPNRLNVALTRARYQMVVVGSRDYFKNHNCKSLLLQKLAEKY